MYIPQGRAESPPVPALLNKMRMQSSEELNATRNSSHDSNLEESVDLPNMSLSRSKSNISLTSLRKSQRPPSVYSEKESECQGGVNDQKKILSQLSTLRQVSASFRRFYLVRLREFMPPLHELNHLSRELDHFLFPDSSHQTARA